MRLLYYSLLIQLVIITQAQEDQWLLEQRLPNWVLNSLEEKNVFSKFELSEYVNPFYLEADFNGDKVLDVAILIEGKSSGKKGILILHGQSQEVFILGLEIMLRDRLDDFSWMDIWKVYREKKTSSLVVDENGDINEGPVINLSSPALEVIKTESASGLIYWDGSAYQWAQLGD